MAIPKYTGTTLSVAGTALSVFGQIQANRAQAQAERENAAWLRQQAEFFADVTKRELDIATREGKFQIGEIAGAFVSGGVSLEGSAMDVVNTAQLRLDQELAAISAQGFMNQQEALLKASAADFSANEISDLGNNILQALGVGLPGAAKSVRTFRQEKKLET